MDVKTAAHSYRMPLLCLSRFKSPLEGLWAAKQIARLTPTERARLARIDRDLRREQFVVGHSVLRWALAATGRGDAQIDVGVDGRVLLRASLPVYTSIAHSAHAVAVLIAEVPVGVDLESVKPMRDLAGVAAMLGLSGDRAHDRPHDVHAILRAWVTAEARLKAGPHGHTQVWHSGWKRCQLAVAGTPNPPFTGVFDVEAEIYNGTEVRWESAQ